MKPTYHNSFWFFSCMVAFKTSYGVLQQSLYYSTVYSNPDVDCMATNLQRANDLVPVLQVLRVLEVPAEAVSRRPLNLVK